MGDGILLSLVKIQEVQELAELVPPGRGPGEIRYDATGMLSCYLLMAFYTYI